MGSTILKSNSSRLALLVLSSSLFLSASLLADVDVIVDEVAARDTTTDGNITIKPTGSINAAGASAVTMNAASKSLSVEANNASGGQPGIKSSNGIASVNVTAAGGGSSITIGTGSGIDNTGNGAAISISGANSFSIDNSGSIQNTSTQDAIRFLAGTTGASVSNRSGGIISGGDDAISLVATTGITILNEAGATIETRLAGGNNSSAIQIEQTVTGSIVNSGALNSVASADDAGAILVRDFGGGVNAKFQGDITNSFGGTIQVDNAHGLRVDDNSSTNKINFTNSGNINAGRSGLSFYGDNQGDIVNTATGVIDVSGSTLGATSGSAIEINDNFTGSITNAGTLKSNNNSTLWLNVTGTGVSGDVTNSGTITHTSTGVSPESAVNISNSIGGKFENSGTIQNSFATKPTVFVAAANTIAGGFHNSGNITNTVANATAIELQGTTSYNQTAGTVTGHITFPGSNTATFTGGSVTGDVITATNGSVINIENTTVSGTLAGTAGQNQTLNVTGNFSSSGVISNFTTTNVQAGTFTINDNPVLMGNGIDPNNFTISNGASVEINDQLRSNAVGGDTTFNNMGILSINAGGALIKTAGALNVDNTGTINLAETGTMSVNSIGPGASNAVYNMTLSDTTNHSKISILDPSDVTNETFNTSITGNGFIANGDAFTLVSGAAIGGTNSIVIGQPVSQTITFVNGSDANNVILTAVRKPFQALTVTENSANVATALDALGAGGNLSQDLKLAISQMDTLPSASEISNALESLAPDSSGGLVEISQQMHNNAVNTVVGRLDQARNLKDFTTAVQAGDEPRFGMGGWGKIYASSISQKNMDTFFGYKASSIGLAVGADKSFSPEFTAGAAFAYSMADIEGRGKAPNELDITSMQLVGYSTYQYDAWHFDTLLSAALNTYKSNRKIEIGSFTRTARSDYKAWQYSGKFETGYNLASGKYRIVPTIGAQYGTLDLDGYTEATAGGIGLAIEAKNVSEITGILGVRFASMNEYVEALYVPEFRMFIHYDFLRENLENTSNFVSGGTVTFDTKSANPDPITYNIGGALTAYASKVIFSMNYDLQLRRQYIGHYGSLKLRYEW